MFSFLFLFLRQGCPCTPSWSETLCRPGSWVLELSVSSPFSVGIVNMIMKLRLSVLRVLL